MSKQSFNHNVSILETHPSSVDDICELDCDKTKKKFALYNYKGHFRNLYDMLIYSMFFTAGCLYFPGQS